MLIVPSTPTPFNLKLTTLSHGWVNLPPFRWDGKTLSWIQRGLLARSFFVAIEQPSGSTLKVGVKAKPPLTTDEQTTLRQTVNRVLNLELDLRGFRKTAALLDKRIERYVAKGGGRLLRGATFFEDLVKTLCTTNASWAHTRNQVEAIIETFGQDGAYGRAFPSPMDMSNATERELRIKCRVGYRAPYLLATIQRCLTAHGDDSEVLNGGLMGFGSYARTHMQVLLNDFSRVPWDSEVRGYAEEHLGIVTQDERRAQTRLQQRLAPWGKWQFLGFKCERKLLKANWIGD